MDLSRITRFRLRRVNPYRGLVIDEATWGEAHDYHRDHQRLHALAFHSAGIAAGLDVRADGVEAGTIVISPGVALDGEGNAIVVGQERRVIFEGVGAGSVYVLLAFQENRVNSDPQAPRGSPVNRIVESYKVEVVDKLPDEPLVELARVQWSGPGNPLKDAADYSDPQQDELDLRFRNSARAARPVSVNIGVVAPDSTAPSMRGVANLLREIDNSPGFAGVFRGQLDIAEGNGGCDLLYVRTPLEPEEPVLTTLASHLSKGGAVLADNCGVEDNASFERSITAVAAKLGLRLANVEPGSRLLDSRYPFAEPPPGAVDGDVKANGNFVLSMRDYGCSWSAACGTQPLPREVVRASLEWGVNVAVAGATGKG